MKKMSSASNKMPNKVFTSIKKRYSRSSNWAAITTIERNVAAENPIQYRINKLDSSRPKEQAAVLSQIIYGQILEINADAVMLRCLIDETERLFQKRRFARQSFGKMVNLAVNQFVEVKIFTKPDGSTFSFADAKRKDLAEKFMPKDYFSQFAGTALFQPLTTHIDADNF